MPDRGPSPERASAARRTMSALTSDVDVWEHFFDHVRIGLALADLTGRYVRVNTTYAELLGRAAEDMVGLLLPEVVQAPDPRWAEEVGQLLGGTRESLTREERYATPHGDEIWLLHGMSLVLTDDGTPGWFAVSAQDVSERRRVEQELRDLTAVLTERAVRDPLTGLANRTLVQERLRGALSKDARTGGTTGLLYLDLDGFKAINDRHGHAVGDAVLRVVAERLSGCVRPSDTVGRLGGDEFVVLAEGASPQGLERLVDRLKVAVAEPFTVDGLDLSVRVSIGLSTSSDGSADAASLLVAADKAMYRDKRATQRGTGR